MRAVLIDSEGVVRNVIEYDPDGEYFVQEGFTLVSNASAVIGSHWDGSIFTPPPEPTPVPEPPKDETLNAMLFVARSNVASQVSAKTFKADNVPMVAPLFPKWEVGVAVNVGEIYIFNNQLVVVIQAHTTQADWTPDVTPALWNIYRDPATIAPWVQPDSTNPYRLGDKVTHNGKTWQSDNDANVWEPPTQWHEITV